jgi:hypothetical protein
LTDQHYQIAARRHVKAVPCQNWWNQRYALLRSYRKQDKLVPLPTFHSGGALVDVADRDALYQAMEVLRPQVRR